MWNRSSQRTFGYAEISMLEMGFRFDDLQFFGILLSDRRIINSLFHKVRLSLCWDCLLEF
jgi:hypothetical protein